MIFSCYQYCFSFWFRCFRLSWFPTLFTGGHLKKGVRRHSHTYSWSAWNLVTSSTYRGRPPTWESPSMWKTTSGWQCSSGSFNAFLNHILLQDWVYWQCAEAWKTDWGRVHTASEVLHLPEPIPWLFLFTLSFLRNRLEPDCFRNSCFREKSYKENLLWQAR